MSKPSLLKPTFDRKHGKWRLSIPKNLSSSGRRERHLFIHHHEALAEANKIRTVHRDYGRSFNMLPANRHNEAVECWKILDDIHGGDAPWGSLRQIVLREAKVIKDREKSITLGALFDDYVDKLRGMHRTEDYLRQYRWLKGHMDFWLETKVSDLTPGNIRFSLQKLPSGNFNSNIRLLRAVLNHGMKKSWLQSNPAQTVDLIHRQKVEVKCLSHQVVERMFRHAQEHAIDLIPSYIVGFFAGLRESELWKLTYSDIRISDTEKYVMVPAAISKVKRKRLVPLSENATMFLAWYFQATNHQPDGEERLMGKWKEHALRTSQQANYQAAAGHGAKWQHNCKRRCFASHFIAANRNMTDLALAMGHATTELTFEHYVGAVSHEDGLAYFNIRP